MEGSLDGGDNFLSFSPNEPLSVSNRFFEARIRIVWDSGGQLDQLPPHTDPCGRVLGRHNILKNYDVASHLEKKQSDFFAFGRLQKFWFVWQFFGRFRTFSNVFGHFSAMYYFCNLFRASISLSF